MHFASVICALLVVASIPATAGAQLGAGNKAPDVELRTLTGANFRLSSLRGRPVIMTFWGTWCPPCREEFPNLATLYRQHRASGLEIVGVNQRDQEASTADVRRFAAEFAVPFPIVLDVRGRWRRAYRLVGLPTTVFIDTAGVIMRMWPGPITPAQLSVGLASIGIVQ